MTTYFEAPDGHGESCLWDGPPGDRPLPILRESDCGAAYWPDVVARMTGTTILSDADRRIVQSCTEVSLEDVAAIRKIHEDRLAELRPQLAATQRAVAMREASLAILAALTGVPHD